MSSEFMFIPQYSSTLLLLHTFELLLFSLVFMAVFSLWLTPGGLAWALSRARTHSRAAIPGPSGIPLLGLVFTFTNSLLTHRILSNLARTFRASTLMAFSVGFTRFVISSDVDTAKQILNGPAFADRPVKESAYELMFHRAMGFAPYGSYWRSLRRVSSTHLFCPKRVARLGELRRGIGMRMVEEMMGRNEGVRVRDVLHYGGLSNVMMSVFGKWYEFDGVVLRELVKEGYQLLGKFNWSDHFPVLGWLDLQRVRRRSRELVSKVDVFVGKIVEEHKLRRGDDDDDFVDVLLGLEGEDRLSDSDIIAVLWEMIFRGADTVSILLEWTLARMILHPHIQTKAQQEIDTVTGPNRDVVHSDLINLPYLQAIVKETLRLHPPGPLLSWARLAVHDTRVGPHFIPAGTTAMVNMWAITHDEKVWPEPEKFRPERFMEEDVAIMGSDLRLAPFGSGRRVCPGKAMGIATVQLWLAQLLQNFRWTGDSDQGVDLEECLKLSMEMKHPLICKAVPRRVLK